MNYNDLLLQKEWFEKCNDILKRDQYRCQKCGCLGYHNSTFYECQSAEELDRLLYGIKIDGRLISFFIDKVRKFDLSELEPIRKEPIDESQIYQISNKYLYDLRLTRGKLFTACTNPVPIVCDSIIDEDSVYGNFSWWKKTDTDSQILQKDKYYMPVVTCSDSVNWIFQYGNYSGFYIFKKVYFNNYVVRIEKRWPTGVVGDQYGAVLFGSIIISICYQNCCMALYFIDQAYRDNYGNYLETPINPKGLNVHHKYYIEGKKPWEYDNDVLITLCQDCHKLEHQTNRTPVYRNLIEKDIIGYKDICDRCGGSGYLPQYSHVEGGICFKCQGEGVCLS